MSYGQKHFWRQPVYGQGPTAATAPPPAPPPPAASATSVPQRQQPPPQTTSVPPAPWLDASCASKLNPSGPTNVPFYLPDDGFTFQPPGMDQEDWRRMELDFVQPSRPWSTLSSVSVSSVSAASSAGSSFSPVQTDASETATVLGHSREPSPQKHPPFISSNANSTSGRTAESTEERVYPCDWAGCGHKQKRVYATHGELVWHVKAEHLLVCPASGCVEGPFGSARMVAAHLAVAHPEIGAEVVKEWQLEPTAPSEGKTTTKRAEPVPTKAVEQQPQEAARVVVESGFDYLASKKRRCREQLQSIVERRIKRARKSSGEYDARVHRR